METATDVATLHARCLRKDKEKGRGIHSPRPCCMPSWRVWWATAVPRRARRRRTEDHEAEREQAGGEQFARAEFRRRRRPWSAVGRAGRWLHVADDDQRRGGSGAAGAAAGAGGHAADRGRGQVRPAATAAATNGLDRVDCVGITAGAAAAKVAAAAATTGDIGATVAAAAGEAAGAARAAADFHVEGGRATCQAADGTVDHLPIPATDAIAAASAATRADGRDAHATHAGGDGELLLGPGGAVGAGDRRAGELSCRHRRHVTFDPASKCDAEAAHGAIVLNDRDKGFLAAETTGARSGIAGTTRSRARTRCAASVAWASIGPVPR